MGLLATNQAIIGGSCYRRCFHANFLPTTPTTSYCTETRFPINIKAFARWKSVNKGNRFKGEKKVSTPQDDNSTSADNIKGLNSPSPSSGLDVDGDDVSSASKADVASSSTTVPSRSSVLQACITTSGLIALLGVVIRQVSHAASSEGLSVSDCTVQVSFGFETWHPELIAGLVILISSSRFVLLKTWPDFAESSETANTLVLTSLQALDYVIVAFLPGITEELLFRGALLPLFGLNLMSAFVVASIFGVLHLGSGRKYSFAAWATFVGFAYGYATIRSSSVVVPMASHGLNNLIGAILWRYTSKSKLKVM